MKDKTRVFINELGYMSLSASLVGSIMLMILRNSNFDIYLVDIISNFLNINSFVSGWIVCIFILNFHVFIVFFFIFSII